jgi:diaminopimelate epimerase
MKISFNKYQGAGNDFIIIDNRDKLLTPEGPDLILKLCDRRFGIGADGLILISDSDKYDFEMQYFNSDGFIGSMCGNGGRCAAGFAKRHGISGNSMRFLAVDGVHEAVLEDNTIRLKMNDIQNPSMVNGKFFLNTGSPHYVIFRDDIENLDVNTEGRKIRWAEEFAPGGTNVNFVRIENNGIFVRTFERGVEAETFSCGTGVTASAIASVLSGHFGTIPVNVKTRGGNLSVLFRTSANQVSDIWLSGPATFVYEGSIEI